MRGRWTPALAAAGLLPYLARAITLYKGSAPLAFIACVCIRNATSGSEARKDAGVAAGLGEAAGACLAAHLHPRADDSSAPLPEELLVCANGMSVHSLWLEAGYSCVRVMALDAAAMALATLASETGAAAAPCQGRDARLAALLASGAALPALLAAWCLHPHLEGVRLALRNCGTLPAHRRALRAAAGALAPALFGALDLPLVG